MFAPLRLFGQTKPIQSAGVSGSGNRIIPMPEIIDLVFAKTSQNARFLLSENERFGLVFVKTESSGQIKIKMNVDHHNAN